MRHLEAFKQMDNWFSLVLFMMVIGAAIGGFTNFLAIRMLFRPFHPFYIGKWRLPFTPGLIPKRHGELAAQIGRLVVSHLVTPESLYKKLTDDTFKREMETWINAKLTEWLDKGITLEQLGGMLSFSHPEQRVRELVNGKIKEKYFALKQQYRDKELKEIVPEQWLQTFHESVPVMADKLIKKGSDYFTSPEGKEKITVMIENFFQSRGRLWNVIQMFFGEAQIAEKLQPELLKFLHHPNTKKLLVSILEEEISKLERTKLDEWLQYADDQKAVSFLQNAASGMLKLDQVFHKPVKEIISHYRATIRKTVLPQLLAVMGHYLTNQSGEILERFQIEDIIRTEIESFSLQRLEELVVSIAKKELAMITYLGALLGGLIGVIQGIIVIVTS
jgi:uncharacterized membrane protein YheB (UPF0754 family)